ncbi:MAG: sodium transport system permease protein [Porticoccaceae bacterium]|jgi:sodium transport system permease protein|nr:ABC transporter permease [Porticoccaceae bacterium]|tara:strand:+ start:2096 stop:3235 length:1140 start_codon:yes stop_codon:yes gene_type:complete
MNNRFFSLLRKELVDAARDKRSVMAGLYYAFFVPILVAGMMMLIIDKVTSPEDLNITINNAAAAPDLIAFLDNQGIRHSDDKSEVKAIQIIIGATYAEQMHRGEPAEVLLIADGSEENLQSAIRETQKTLRSYSSEMASLRLIARGINPKIMNSLNIKMQDQATSESKGGQLMAMIILFMLLSIFVSGMNLAIDTSAGERERNSLALLLSHPISLRELIASKVCAVSFFGMLGLVLVLIMSKIIYPLVPWQELGFSVDISLNFMIATLIAGVFIAIFAASMQLFVSFMAKSFKEAQTYISFVLFIPMALSYAVTFDLATDELRWAPVTGQLQALIDLMKGKEIPLLQLTVSCLSTLIISVALVLGMERLLKSEKIVFGL